jgi:acetylornithine/N-succinyldiaminopimelate aminotransferase
MNDIMKMEEAYEVSSYKRFPFAIKKGEGSYVETEDGRRLLDLYGGHAVVGLGHCHPKVSSAIKEQLDQLVFYSNVVYSKIRGEAAKALCDMAPDVAAWKSFFVNSGSEANENALKIARMKSGASKIVSFEGGFHGRTAAAIAATGIEKVREACQPKMPGHVHLPYGDLAAVEAELKLGDVAAILLEPIQSMAGIVEADPAFYTGLASLCEEHGAFLIYDEVQTGLGRTGRNFYAGRHGVIPHMITLGKALANGIPMGAVLFRAGLYEKINIGDLGSTFGGGPIACAALKATLELIDEPLLKEVERLGAKIKTTLVELEVVKEVLGEGMLLGIAFKDQSAKAFQVALLEAGIITGLSNDPKVLRLLPPLNLKESEVDFFLETMAHIAEKVGGGHD